MPDRSVSTSTGLGRNAWMLPVVVCPLIALACASAGSIAAALHPPAPPTTAAAADVTPPGVVFDQPENLVYDAASDVYLVANIVGGPTAHDANGFISRVGPDGRVIARKWIDGTKADTRLDAPKGLAIHGDTLVVADVGAVRLFDRRTGASLGAWPVPSADALLNDVSFAPDGTLRVTDTGPNPPQRATSSDHDAIYRFDRTGRATTVAQDTSLDRPDGLVALADGVLYATFGANRVVRIPSSGKPSTMAVLPGAKVDGLRQLSDGSFVVTSWDAHTVFHLMPDGSLHALLSGVKSPAGVAIDTRRDQLAVTSMMDNRFYLVSLH